MVRIKQRLLKICNGTFKKSIDEDVMIAVFARVIHRGCPSRKRACIILVLMSIHNLCFEQKYEKKTNKKTKKKKKKKKKKNRVFFFYLFWRWNFLYIWIGVFSFCVQSLWGYEPQLEKTYLLTCAPNEYSNQPAHPKSGQSLRSPHEETLEGVSSFTNFITAYEESQ